MRTETLTRARIVAAAAETLRAHGFAGTTARAVAKAGGFNAALIYYYFPTLEDLLVATLAESSAARMDAYAERLSAARSLDDVAAAARRLFEEDIETGHITVLTELISASLGAPLLGARVVELMSPWVRLMQDTIARFTHGSALDVVLPPSAIAESIVALYLGMEMLYHLDHDRSRADRFFDAIARVVPLLSAFTTRPAS